MLRASLVAIGLAICSASAFSAEAGRVVLVVGKAEIAARPAALDAPVQEGDELSTGADGYIYMKTVDDGFLILRPNSKARITAYHVDQKNPANTRIKLELLSGVARSISGVGVKRARQNFRFNTPVAAIGVRGTDFIVYTNQQSSWVSVVSGGVVVSGFSGKCGPDGGGPCEGGASRELFAGHADAMLQVQRGQEVPQLLHNITIAPELSTPARSDEPVGKAPTAGMPGAPNSLDPQKVPPAPPVPPQPVPPSPLVPLVPPPPPPVSPPVPPPLVEVQPPLPPKTQEVFWGRWQAVAATVVLPAALKKNDVDNPTFLGDYAISRTRNAVLVMPNEGKVAFNLASSEAYIQHGSLGNSKGNVDSGRLGINFSDRTFATSLVVSGAGGSYDINGNGVVDNKGAFSNNIGSQTLIRGILSGANVEEAGYIFKNSSYPGVTISGASTWKR